MFTSIDLVRFTWFDKKPDDKEIQQQQEKEVLGKDSDDDEDAQNHNSDISPVEDGIRHTSNATIWINVLPNTLTGAVAHKAAMEILEYLKEEFGITNVDVAFRDS